MVQEEPLVSVLTTLYNREKYIAEAIESVLASSYKNFELIIVDDGSSDRSLEIARSYQEKDSRIKIYINDRNLGDYPNRNKAASYASGKYLMYVDSDDMILEKGIEHCVEAMEAFPEAVFGMRKYNKNVRPYFLKPEEAIREHFFDNPFLVVGPSGTILRRSFFEKIGCYPELYGPANDMYFNLKAVVRGGVLMLPFDFNFYRIHEGQELNNKYSYLYNGYCYMRDILIELNFPLSIKEKKWVANKNRRRFLTNFCKYIIKTGNINKAIVAYKHANFTSKDILKAIFH